MSKCIVFFYPQKIKIEIEKGETLLEAVSKANIPLNNTCGGEGVCGRCKMIVKKGKVSGGTSNKLTPEEIKNSYVLACMSQVEKDLVIEIPEATLAKEKSKADKDADLYKGFVEEESKIQYKPSPLVAKVYLELEKPTLKNNRADHQNVCEEIKRKLKIGSVQMGLEVIRSLPEILRENDYKITATFGLRRDTTEIMNIEAKNTVDRDYMVIVDIGTTTIAAQLVNTNTLKTIDAKACFNSQGIYGREVTARIMSAEKNGHEKLQELVIKDINILIKDLVKENKIDLKDINAVVCAGNTIMEHFLLALPTQYIRRTPYVATTVDPPPLRAAELGIEINPRGLLYALPGISGWVGSDLTAGILATEMYKKNEISLLVDIGTNGEVIIGNKEWLMAASASAGPALEGASVECGIRAGTGAIGEVYAENGKLLYKTIGDSPAEGICGSGIIDFIAALLNEKIINRSGEFIEGSTDRMTTIDGIKRFTLEEKNNARNKKPVFITENDIEDVITAKAAIFAAIKILLKRLEL